MAIATLDQFTLTNHEVRERLRAAKPQEAARFAAIAAAEALSDLGIANIVAGQAAQGINRLKAAIELNPTCQSAFHNLVATYLKGGVLKAAQLNDLLSHLIRHWPSLPWANDYKSLFFLPRFVNLEFVRGKCNLKCRMCIGINNPAHPNRLSYVEAADFEKMLANVPTIGGVTLSSGDSDPLLHPQLDDIIRVAGAKKVMLDLYTNGLPLSAKTARLIIESGGVGFINFSIDAATPETYAKIRGGDFAKLLSKIRMLQDMKLEKSAKMPRVSLSFVAMADTIHELPAFVEMAADLLADQIIVDDLSGWLEGTHNNHPASDNPQAGEFLDKADRIAAAKNIRLNPHEGLSALLRSFRASENSKLSLTQCIEQRTEVIAETNSCTVSVAPANSQRHTADVNFSAPSTPLAPVVNITKSPAKMLAYHLHVVQGGTNNGAERMACCGWIDGVWVNQDGKLEPCCMVRKAADMGYVQDGPLHANEKYLKAKSLLVTGKVFKECIDQRMCGYVQQQKGANTPLRIITDEELGDIAPVRTKSIPVDEILAEQRHDGTPLQILQPA